MKQIFKTRWNGHRVQIEFTKLGFIYGGQGQSPCLTIKTSNRVADKLGLPRVQRYKVNPDIVETIGDPATYARKLLTSADTKIQYRRNTQMTQQLHLLDV